MIETASSGISYQLRDMYSIRRCCWNVAIYKRKVHHGKIKIIYVPFLTSSHNQFLGVGQDINHDSISSIFMTRTPFLHTIMGTNCNGGTNICAL
jgi:hypothetical protein